MKQWLGAFKKTRGQSLTAIYFFERGNTQRLHLPTSKLIIFCMVICLTLAWAIAGTGVVVGLWSHNQNLQKQIVQAQQGVFYYQSKYENVFEKTYKKPAGEPVSKNPETTIKQKTPPNINLFQGTLIPTSFFFYMTIARDRY